jgi:DNA-binding Lrp family transcriptional regulator
MNAYVLVYSRAGKVQEVVEALAGLPEVRTVDACWGRPDVFARVEVADARALSELVLKRVHSLDGVEATDTRIVIEF